MHLVSQLYVAALTTEEFVLPTPPIQSSTGHGLHRIITSDNYSSLEQLLAVTAYVQWFIANLKQRKPSRSTGPLNPGELNSARLEWIKACQEQTFTSEISAPKSQHGTKHSKKIPILVRQL